MTTSTIAVVIGNDTLAHYVGWGQAVSDRIAATGMTKTADTGQVAWGSVATLPTASAYPHYEIWQFTDTLQATMPMFMKIEYGAASTVGNPAIRIQFGTGTDGAGMLTGVTSRQQGTNNLVASTSATSNIYAAGDGSFLTLIVGLPYNGPLYKTPLIMALFDRSRDNTGSAVGDGAFVGFIANSGNSSLGNNYNSDIPPSAVYQQMYSTSLGVWGTASPGMPVLLGGNHFGTAFTLSESGAMPMVTLHPLPHPGLACLGAYKDDFIAGMVVSINVLGSLHTYIALDSTVNSCNPMGFASTFDNSNGLIHSLLVRYE